jgi:EAL domain-containing protein (putative c-di-GMP-specific phosphodiesterase class I)
MICIITRHAKFRTELTAMLSGVGAAYREIDPDSELVIASIYDPKITAIVVDAQTPQLAQAAWIDLLTSLSCRLPVFVLGSPPARSKVADSRGGNLLGWLGAADASSTLTMLQAAGVLGDVAKPLNQSSIPIFNAQVPLHMIQGSGALSMLVINASGLRKISVDYGFEVYRKVQECFQHVLLEMWGNPGSFRRNDILMQKSPSSNTYYVFLEQSRVTHALPAPGVLEKVADRLTLKMQQQLWAEIFKPRSEKRLPDCIQTLPEFSLGHATALNNPCLDTLDVIDQLFEMATEVSKVQRRRVQDREREILQTIIHSRDILYPNYQAIFNLQTVTKDKVDQAQSSKSIVPLVDSLYGFESLIRVRPQNLEDKLASDHLVYVDMKLLRPDILFAMAAHSRVSLELDQLCMAVGVAGGVELPGPLMVNILPRNLMHLERLSHLLTPRSDLVFEISESEGFSNPKQMEKIRDYVKKINCKIAADDFGKGHASIERVIKMRPALIKLDRSLVEKIHLEPAKKMFVDGVVKAAKTINATVLAEGIETWDEAITVQAMGVELIQGFLLHRPESLERILEQIRSDKDQTLGSVA